MNADPSEPRVISDMLSVRLHSLAGLSAASAALRVERKFGLSLLEWRSIAHLGGFAPLSLKELATRAGLDKSHASRTVSALIVRGLVFSAPNEADGRGVVLTLSAKGQALYKKVFADAVARNDRLLSPLTPEKRRLLMEMLAALTLSARRVLDDERRAAAGETIDGDDEPMPVTAARPAPVPTRPRAAPGSVAANVPDLGEIRYLVTRLNELIGGT